MMDDETDHESMVADEAEHDRATSTGPVAPPAPPASDVPASNPAADPASPYLSLNDFCAELRRTTRAVEMIAAFQATEIAAKRMVDQQAAYEARFDALGNTPA